MTRNEWTIKGIGLITWALKILSKHNDEEVKDWKQQATIWLTK